MDSQMHSELVDKILDEEMISLRGAVSVDDLFENDEFDSSIDELMDSPLTYTKITISTSSSNVNPLTIQFIHHYTALSCKHYYSHSCKKSTQHTSKYNINPYTSHLGNKQILHHTHPADTLNIHYYHRSTTSTALHAPKITLIHTVQQPNKTHADITHQTTTFSAPQSSYLH